MGWKVCQSSCESHRINDIATQNWASDVSSHRLYHNYKIFKTVNRMEGYLLKLNLNDRSKLCQFRCGNHKLLFAIDRFLEGQAPKHCTLCRPNNGDYGDEYHYVMVCPARTQQRSIYLRRYYYNRPNTMKFQELLNSTNIRILSHLVKFVRIILSYFKWSSSHY